MTDIVFFTAESKGKRWIVAMDYDAGASLPPPPCDGLIYEGYYLYDHATGEREPDRYFDGRQVIQTQEVSYPLNA